MWLSQFYVACPIAQVQIPQLIVIYYHTILLCQFRFPHTALSDLHSHGQLMHFSKILTLFVSNKSFLFRITVSGKCATF